MATLTTLLRSWTQQVEQIQKLSLSNLKSQVSFSLRVCFDFSIWPTALIQVEKYVLVIALNCFARKNSRVIWSSTTTLASMLNLTFMHFRDTF